MSQNFIYRCIFSIVTAPLVFLIIFLGNIYFKMLILLIFLLGLFEIYKIKNNITKTLIFFILLIFVYSCIKIESLDNGYLYIALILIISILSDSGGYIVGKLTKGKKIKYISPNKTYHGFLGSLFFTQFSFLFMKHNNFYIYNSFWFDSIFIFFSTVIVIVGDLFFSFLKRKNNIKDYSNIIPGHGGIFDRIDGVIFLTIFYYIFIYY